MNIIIVCLFSPPKYDRLPPPLTCGGILVLAMASSIEQEVSIFSCILKLWREYIYVDV